MIELRRIGPDEFAGTVETVIAIYTAAMRPPSDQVSGRMAIMRNHATYPDFTCVLAETGAGTTERAVVGFGYGFRGSPGQWWHDVVRQALAERAGEATAHGWFGHAFEIAELHVRPEYQGKGVGRRLLHALCEGRPERTAVLSTHDEPTAARHLYRSVGFAELITAFMFPGGYENYAIMGTALPLMR